MESGTFLKRDDVMKVWIEALASSRPALLDHDMNRKTQETNT